MWQYLEPLWWVQLQLSGYHGWQLMSSCCPDCYYNAYTRDTHPNNLAPNIISRSMLSPNQPSSDVRSRQLSETYQRDVMNSWRLNLSVPPQPVHCVYAGVKVGPRSLPCVTGQTVDRQTYSGDSGVFCIRQIRYFHVIQLLVLSSHSISPYRNNVLFSHICTFYGTLFQLCVYRIIYDMRTWEPLSFILGRKQAAPCCFL